MKRVFVYTRVSTAQQVEGDGHPRQLKTCRDFCAGKGWEILRDFPEQTSGTVDAMDRKVLSECIELCGDAYDVRTIVVERADRIARDLMVSELFLKECRERGIEVYCADSGEELAITECDPTRKLLRQMMGALAQWEKSTTAKKLLAGRKRTAEKTGWPCGGVPAYGRGGPHELLWVRRILFFHRAGQGMTKLCRSLNYNPAWRAQRPKLWSPSTVSGIIRTWNHRSDFSGEITFDSLLEKPTLST